MTKRDVREQIPTRTPAWLIHGLYRTFEVADALFDYLGVSYTAMSGTLLGAVRHGGIIPWDDDGDLVIRMQDFGSVKEAAEPFVRERGFGFFKGWEEVGMIKIFPLDGQRTQYPFYYPWVDIFPMSELDGRWVYESLAERRAWPNDVLDAEAFETVRRSDFGPIQLATVNDEVAHKYLKSAYGPSWSREAVFYGFHAPMNATDSPAVSGLLKALHASPSTRRGMTEGHRTPLDGPMRCEGLEIDEVDDGLVIYQGHVKRAHYLNNTAALIFKMSSGANSVEDIADVLRQIFHLAASPLAEVARCIDELCELQILRESAT